MNSVSRAYLLLVVLLTYQLFFLAPWALVVGQFNVSDVGFVLIWAVPLWAQDAIVHSVQLKPVVWPRGGLRINFDYRFRNVLPPFEKEPDFGENEIARGIIPTVPPTGFIRNITDNELLLDLDHDRDFVANPRVTYKSIYDGHVVFKEIHVNTVRQGDWVYGSTGNGPAFMAAVNIRTGEIGWRERGFAKANCIMADGRLYILDEDGNLAMTTASPDGLEVHAKVELMDAVAWTVPTIVGKTMYARDQNRIVALRLG